MSMNVPRVGTALVNIATGGTAAGAARQYNTNLGSPMQPGTNAVGAFNKGGEFWKPITDGLADVAKVSQEIIQRSAQEQAETEALGAYAGWAGEINAYVDNDVMNRKGVKAFGVVDDVTQFSDKAEERYAKSLTTEAARKMFSERAAPHRIGLQSKISAYEGGERREARFTAIQSAAATEKNLAMDNFNSDRLFGEGKTRGLQYAAEMAAMNGWDEKTTALYLQKAAGEYDTGRVERFAAAGDYERAYGAWESGNFDPDTRLKVGEILGKKYEDALMEEALANPEGMSKMFQERGYRSAADFAAQRESGNDPAAIGYDGTGGTSYGAYQISSETMPGFLKHLDAAAPELAARLRAAGSANTGSKDGAMPTVWKQIAAEDPEGFRKLQGDFIRETHVEPALKGAPPEMRAALEGNSTLAKMLYSTAIQHGGSGANNILTAAWEKSGGDPKTLIKAVYTDRKTRFSSSTPEVRASVIKQLEKEEATLLGMVDSPTTDHAAGESSATAEPQGIDSLVSPAGRRRVYNATQVSLRRRRAEEAADLHTRERDVTAAFQEGLEVDPAHIPTEAEYVRAYGAEEGPKRFAGLMADKQMGDNLRTLRDLTPQQQQDMFTAGNTAEPGSEGYADTVKRQALLQTAIVQDRKMREADPAAYTLMADDNSRKLYEAMQSNPTPEATAAYARGVRASLESRGMPTDAPLLPKAQAAAISQAFMQAAPQQSAALVLQTRDQWGEHWPDVYKQLVKDKDNPLPAAAYAIGAGMSPEPAILLAEAAQNPNFMAQAKEVAPEAFKEVDELLPGVFAPLGESMRAQGGIKEEVRLREQCGLLAMQYAMKGLTPEDAVNKAYQEIGGGRYAFQDGYRVPVSVNADAVQLGTKAFLEKLTGTEGALKPDLTEEWRDPKDVDRLTRAGVKQNARWVTDNDEAGLVLYRGPFAVQKADGTPVMVTWEELIQSGNERMRQGQEEQALRFKFSKFPQQEQQP